MSTENLTQWRLVQLKDDVVNAIRGYLHQSGAI